MSSKKKKICQGIAVAAACAFILYGTFRGEIFIVLDKAIHICFECIGLG